jgi:ribosomal protein S18 acetylase RimI-like enzyme
MGPLEPAGPSKPREHNVRRAQKADLDALIEMLVRAFDDDPVANFMFCKPKNHTRAMRRFFSIQLHKDYMKSDEVWITDDISGAAMWAPPGKPRPGAKEMLNVLPLLPELLPLGHMRHALHALFVVESLRPKVPHWYLATLGTEPAMQGHGVGSALLSSVLERVDALGEAAYLESSKERNVGFYSRFGFNVTKELKVAGGAPTIWLMWREARLS